MYLIWKGVSSKGFAKDLIGVPYCMYPIRFSSQVSESLRCLGFEKPTQKDFHSVGLFIPPKSKATCDFAPPQVFITIFT